MSYTKNPDGTYGPVIGEPIIEGKPNYEHFYLPMSYHNKTAASKHHKGRWVIDEGNQFHYFMIADENKASPRWLCKENSCLFSIGENGKVVLGGNDEKLAKFKIPSNISDPWHGYPVTTKDGERWNTPSEELLDLWFEHKVIDDITRKRIERAKL